MLVQRRRDSRAALRLMRKLLKKQRFVPKLLVTDKLRSYASAFRRLRLTCPHEPGVAEEQPSRKLPSGGATTRTQDATVQVGPLRSAFFQHSHRRPQHLQPSTPSRLALDPPDLPEPRRRTNGEMRLLQRDGVFRRGLVLPDRR